LATNAYGSRYRQHSHGKESDMSSTSDKAKGAANQAIGKGHRQGD
jgi:hypothetical protein